MHLVDTVQELGLEGVLQFAQHLILHGLVLGSDCFGSCLSTA